VRSLALWRLALFLEVNEGGLGRSDRRTVALLFRRFENLIEVPNLKNEQACSDEIDRLGM
jgi:hypothetical protein